jgi:hypothetical protein
VPEGPDIATASQWGQLSLLFLASVSSSASGGPNLPNGWHNPPPPPTHTHSPDNALTLTVTLTGTETEKVSSGGNG